MKNIAVYSDCSHAFFETIINSKRHKKSDAGYKRRLASLSLIVKPQFKDYDDNFTLNSLVSIKSSTHLGQQKTDLLSLYDYGRKNFQRLKIRLTTDSENRVHNICQNCTISEVNSFDHYIPKGDFPEFSVHPKNLIPSCTKCNSKKSTVWRENNELVFLNLYLDILPELQYLFVDFIIVNDDINIQYKIENRYNIDSDFFELIKTHYDKLELLQRFKENSDTIISEIDNQFSVFSSLLEIDTIAETIIDKNEKDKEIYGFNYWKSILTISLLSNVSYLKHIESKYFK